MPRFFLTDLKNCSKTKWSDRPLLTAQKKHNLLKKVTTSIFEHFPRNYSDLTKHFNLCPVNWLSQVGIMHFLSSNPPVHPNGGGARVKLSLAMPGCLKRRVTPSLPKETINYSQNTAVRQLWQSYWQRFTEQRMRKQEKHNQWPLLGLHTEGSSSLKWNMFF